MTNSYSHNFLPAKQPSHPAPMPASQSTPALSASNRSNSQRKPDWHEFYKNGVPKEVILIDDDSPPRQQPSRQGRRGPEMAGAPLPQPSSGKKRKLDQSYGQEYHDSPAFSTHPAHFGDTASVSSHSGTRTTSHQTTAPTSLESYGSNAASNSYEDVNVGQKRKRAQPQKETRAQVKRKQQEATSDAFHDYVPPPAPVRKAPEVHVPVIRDVSENPAARGRRTRAYKKKTLANKNAKVDDDDGHYIINPGSSLTDRCMFHISTHVLLLTNNCTDDIQRLLGQGTFGKVVEAYDKKKKTKCAVKIIRSVQKYRDASRIELRVLSTLALNDRTNKNKCIHLRDSFDFRNHICIVTDLLGQSVFDFLKGNGFVPFPSTQIQSFARQLFTSVAFLHDLNLIHTDLKPENILLVNGLYQTFTYNRNIPSSSLTTSRTARQRRVLLDSEIRLIDFGSATFDDEYHSSVVSTRHYRAPEIILQLGWSFPCDIWSIGCIIVEFFTGDALFQTHDNLEHLAMMENVCNGKIPPKLVKQVTSAGRGNNGNQAAKFFQRGKLCYPNQETSRASRKYVKAMKHLHVRIKRFVFSEHLLTNPGIHSNEYDV
jgi:dual-specificity kinase